MENMNHSEDGTFVVKNNKKISILAFVGCLVLAFIIWIYVMNAEISDNSKTFTIKMDIRGETALLNDKNYSIFGANETWVKVTVQGTNADLNKCSEKDFGVYIDVSSIDKTGITPLNIVVESNSAAVTVVSTDPVQTTVFADERINEKDIPLSVTLGENVVIDPALEVKIDKSVIAVSGPKTYVNEIAYAKLLVNTLDIQGGDENSAYKVEFPVEFYDIAGNVVKTPYLVYNASNIAITVEEIEVADTDVADGEMTDNATNK